MEEKKTAAIVYAALEIASAVLFAVGFCVLFFAPDDGDSLLGMTPVEKLRMFTVLSNIFAGTASAVCAVYTLTHLGKKLPGPLVYVKFVSVAAVMVTFFTVLLFLGPAFGFLSMYRRANLYFHLIVPLVSLAATFFAKGDEIPLKKAVLYGFIPVIAYASYYCTRFAILKTGDWYGFFTWGVVPGIGIFLILLLGNLAISLGLAAIYNKAAGNGISKK